MSQPRVTSSTSICSPHLQNKPTPFPLSHLLQGRKNGNHRSRLSPEKMSGGVGPIDDINLPAEDHGLQKPPSLAAATSTTTATTTNRTGLLSFRQLNALAIVIILSASGMVSFQEVSFSLLSFLYLFLLSRFSFPSLGREPAVFDPNNRILPIYVTVGAIVGLLLPILYIFEGIYEGDKEGITAAAPHVFLLASQIFMEGVAFSGNFSTPIRVFVPVFFNAMRILTLMEWLVNEFSKAAEDGLGWGNPRRWAGLGRGSRRDLMGRALALANMGFWSFNLFCFLLPVYMPKAFKMYYSKLLKRE